MKPAFISEFQPTTVSSLFLSESYFARFDVTFFLLSVHFWVVFKCFFFYCLLAVSYGLERGIRSKIAASNAK